MKKIHIGLAPGFNSFWDQATRTRLDSQDSHKVITYQDISQLDSIVHGVLSSPPTLVAYSKLPAEAIERWEAKFQGFFKSTGVKMERNLKGEWVEAPKNRALDRSENLLKENEDKPGLEEENEPETPVDPEEPEETEEPETPEETEEEEEEVPEGEEVEGLSKAEAKEVKVVEEKPKKSVKKAAAKK